MTTLTFEIVQDDTYPRIGGTLIDAEGAEVLVQAGDVVTFRMSPVVEGLAAPIDQPALTTPGSADVFYAWQAGDTATPGVYKAEFHVARPGGIDETFPNDDTIRVVIRPKSG